MFNPCIYWDSDTLDVVIENENTCYRKLNINVDKHLTVNDLPNKRWICGADVNVVFAEKKTRRSVPQCMFKQSGSSSIYFR